MTAKKYSHAFLAWPILLFILLILYSSNSSGE